MRLLPFYTVLVLLAAGCRNESSPGEQEVARIGDRSITADEFVLNYEFGFTHLKQSPGAYLKRMIDEKLLALEGYELGLDELPEVKERLESLREKLLVEAVFERDVNAGIQVSEEEIRELMQRDRVRFKLRYIPAATESQAYGLRSQVLERGFEYVLGDFIESESGNSYRRADFESPYVHWYDISPALFDAVERLKPGEVSGPVEYRGSYLLLQVVDVQREPVAPVSDPDEIERYRQVLFQRKAKERARSYIGEKMKPLDLRLKGRTFDRLRRHLWYLRSKAGSIDNLETHIDSSRGPAPDSIRAMADETLFTTKEENWTVSEFITEYPADRYPLSQKSEEDFSRDFYDGVGLLLRDRAFVREAEASGLDETADFEEDYERWADKWVFRAAVRRFQTDGDIPLEQHLEELRERYDVEVNEEVLRNLDLRTMRGPADPNVMLLERHSGQPAIPVVDPWWGMGREMEKVE